MKIPLASMDRVATLVELVSKMPRSEPRYALLLGAGCSLSSGIPAAGTLMEGWKKVVFLDLIKAEKLTTQLRPYYKEWRDAPLDGPDEIALPSLNRTVPTYATWRKRAFEAERHPSEYSLLFSRAIKDVDARQGFIENLCSDVEPCAGYVYLACLVRDNVFRTILTTNFDDLAHDAIFRYAGMKPAVCAFDSQIETIRPVGPRPKVIKLHGDFLYSSLRNVGSEVSRLDVNIRRKFEEICVNYGLIVLGYSGGDQSVMDPIRSMLTQPSYLRHGIHWCMWVSPDHKDPLLEIPDELGRLRNTYPDKFHLYAVDPFDAVMGALFRGCQCDPPADLIHPETRSYYARLRDAISNAEQSWRLEEPFRGLLSTFRESHLRAPHPGAGLLDRADALQLRAIAAKPAKDTAAHLKGERYQAAAKKFEEVVRMCESIQEYEREAPVSRESPASDDHQGPRNVGPWTFEMSLWLRRRRSGALTGCCECLYYGWTGAKLRGFEEDRQAWSEFQHAAQFSDAASAAYADCHEGWRTAKRRGFPPSVVGHIRNFAYNGLLAVAYWRRAGREATKAMRRDVLAWVAYLTSDRAFGEEYLAEVEVDIGGLDLLTEAAVWESRPEDTEQWPEHEEPVPPPEGPADPFATGRRTYART